MKLDTKLLLGFGSLWAMLLLATLLVLLLLKQEGMSLQDAFDSNFESVHACGAMIDSIDAENQLAMNQAWTDVEMPAGKTSDAAREFAEAQESQQRNITLPGEAQLTREAFDRAADFHRAFADFSSAEAAQRTRIFRTEVFPQYRTARHAIQAVNDLNFAHLRTVNASLQRNISFARSMQILFTAMGAVFAVGSIIVLRKTILGPLHSLTLSVRQVEAGVLDMQVPVRAMDELGELSVAFNAMASKLQEYRQLDAERLRRTQQTTQLAIDSLPDAVAVLNPRGEVEISNYQARVHFGLAPGDMMETGHEGNARPQWLRDLLATALGSGRAVEPLGYGTALQLFSDGEERFLLPRAVPMFSEVSGGQKTVIGAVVTLVDVTRLRQADELKSGLLSTVSHELKTPLAAARFSVQLLAQESVAPLSEQQRQLVRAACEGTDRLHRIIETLLRVRQIEEGRLTVRAEAILPGAIVQQAVAPLKGEFGKRGLELMVNVPEDLPVVRADVDLIGHVMTNLLTNALKFAGAPGRVEVSVAQVEEGVAFTVADSGPGIPPEHVGQLFSRYFRAGVGAEKPGMGLGLAIAKQLVEAHGGRIYFARGADGGAQFTFVLGGASQRQE